MVRKKPLPEEKVTVPAPTMEKYIYEEYEKYETYEKIEEYEQVEEAEEYEEAPEPEEYEDAPEPEEIEVYEEAPEPEVVEQYEEIEHEEHEYYEEVKETVEYEEVYEVPAAKGIAIYLSVVAKSTLPLHSQTVMSFCFFIYKNIHWNLFLDKTFLHC